MQAVAVAVAVAVAAPSIMHLQTWKRRLILTMHLPTTCTNNPRQDSSNKQFLDPHKPQPIPPLLVRVHMPRGHPPVRQHQVLDLAPKALPLVLATLRTRVGNSRWPDMLPAADRRYPHLRLIRPTSVGDARMINNPKAVPPRLVRPYT